MSNHPAPYRLMAREGQDWGVASEHFSLASLKPAFLEDYPLAETRVERLIGMTGGEPIYTPVPDHEYGFMFDVTMQWVYACRRNWIRAKDLRPGRS